jgi:hypothetical protein
MPPAREYLESRKRACEAEEILSALERGGFDFSTQDWKAGPRLRPLAITLGKNSAIFHRLPNGTYGLRVWYSNLPKKGGTKATKNGATDGDVEEEATPPAVEPA